MSWQPIETAPKDGREVLIAEPSDFSDCGYFFSIARWEPRGDDGFWDTGYASETDGDPIEVCNPAKWMEIPSVS